MITRGQALELLDGTATLECLGNFYEFAGYDKGKLVFQSLSNDSHIETSYENLLSMPEYSVAD